jgi:hypothetical protein
MHIAAQPQFPGYHDYAAHARVRFNGTLISHVVFADEETGRIVQYPLDTKGRVIRDAKLVERFGCVSIAITAFPEIEAKIREQQRFARRNRK